MPRFAASFTNSGSSRLEDRDHGAFRLLHDARDQVERVLGALAQADERDVGHRLGGGGRDLGDLELARDHVMAHRGHQAGGDLEAFLSLVGDQDAKRFKAF